MENKAAIVFGGQGSQFTGMGMKLYESFLNVKTIFELASSIVGHNVAEMCFEASQEDLKKSMNSQICTLTLELAIYEVFNEMGIPFHAVAGFSLGEYAALVAGGIIDMKTAFELVKSRSMAMETEIADDAGGMVAVFCLTIDQIELICEELGKDMAVISNYNSYKQIIVSYRNECFDELSCKIRTFGGRLIPLKVNRPYHHPMMKLAADKYRNDLYKQTFKNPEMDFFINVTGKKYHNSYSLPVILYKQIFMPVQWIKTIENMLLEEIYTFYEISIKPTLGVFINDVSKMNVKTIDVQKDLLHCR